VLEHVVGDRERRPLRSGSGAPITQSWGRSDQRSFAGSWRRWQLSGCNCLWQPSARAGPPKAYCRCR
jgi:hypothetical protein